MSEWSAGGLEFRRLFRAAGRVAGAVGMSAGAGELTAIDDQILVANRPFVEPAFEDFTGSRRIARLS